MAGNRGGRPTTATPPGQKVTLSIRTTSGVKAELAASAHEQGANLSEHGEWLIRIGLRDAGRTRLILDDALEVAFGPNFLMGHLLRKLARRIAPKTEWLHDESAKELLCQGFRHALDVLHDPEGIRIFTDGSGAGKAEFLLYRLAEDDTEPSRFGDDIGNRLIRRYKVVSDKLAEKKPPESNEQDDQMWARSIDKAHAADAAQRAREAEAARDAGNARRARRGKEGRK